MTPAPPDLVSEITTALNEPLPCPACGRVPLRGACRCLVTADQKTAARAVHIAHRLGDLGLLAAPAEQEEVNVEEVARWLAELSGHPRFADDGWKNLLTAAGDVEMAFRRAQGVVSASVDPNGARALAEARAILLAAVRRASEVTGL